jgi:hypothetical protein
VLKGNNYERWHYFRWTRCPAINECSCLDWIYLSSATNRDAVARVP